MASVFQPMARGRISRGTSIGPIEALAGIVKARPTPNSAATAKMPTRLGRSMPARKARLAEHTTCSAQQAMQNLAPVVAIGGLARQQHEGEHRHELRQPDHADEKRAILDRMIEPRDRIHLPAQRHALRQHRHRRQEARQEQQAEIGIAKEGEVFCLAHVR